MPCWYQAAFRSNEANTNPLLQPRYAEEYLWIQSIANFEVDGLQQQKMTVCWFCQLRTGNRVTIHTDSPELHKKRLKNFPWSHETHFWHFLSFFGMNNMKAWILVWLCQWLCHTARLKSSQTGVWTWHVMLCVNVCDCDCVCILNCKVYLIKCPMGVEAY